MLLRLRSAPLSVVVDQEAPPAKRACLVLSSLCCALSLSRRAADTAGARGTRHGARVAGKSQGRGNPGEDQARLGRTALRVYTALCSPLCCLPACCILCTVHADLNRDSLPAELSINSRKAPLITALLVSPFPKLAMTRNAQSGPNFSG
jgi:hypothetical protein